MTSSPSPLSRCAATLPLVAALLVPAACERERKQDAGAGQAPPTVTVAAPVRRALTEWDEYTGRFAAVERVEIRPRVNGYLAEVRYDDGAIVQAGAPLFLIDPRPYQAAAATAAAGLAQARARLTFANGEVERARELRRTGAGPERTVDQRVQEQLVAQAELLAAEAALTRAQLDLEFTEIKAPVTGRVGRAAVRPGNLVGEGTLLATVVSLDPIHFYFDADQSAYLRYQRLARSGQRPSSREEANPVHLALGDEEGFPHRGRMDFVDNEIESGTGTIRGRAMFANPEGLFTPGQFGRMRLVGSAEYTATLVPQAAIGTDQGRRYVYVVDRDGVARQRTVQLGPVIDGLRVVREGIAPEDRVAVNGLQRLRPNLRVTAREQPATPAVGGQPADRPEAGPGGQAANDRKAAEVRP